MGSDEEVVLEAVIRDALTNPSLESVRLDCAPPDDRRFALVDGHDSRYPRWPAGLRPVVPGRIYTSPPVLSSRDQAPPLLGLRLDHCDLAQKGINPFRGNVWICMFNAGGWKGHEHLPWNGISIYYIARRGPTGWVVQLSMWQS
jgi:hypothetical protein